MQKTILIFDIDGTLSISSRYVQSQKVIDSLAHAKKMGCILSTASGRCLERTLKIQCINLFDYAGVLCGNALYDIKNKKFVLEPQFRLSKDDVLKIENYCKQHNIAWTYKNTEKTYRISQTPLPTHIGKAHQISQKTFEKHLNRNEIFQITAEQGFSQDFIDSFKDTCIIDMKDYYDIVPMHMSKAQIVKYFRTQFPNCRIIAFGDSNNDIPMLEASDISIAMGNAPKHIQDMCTFTTKSVNEDGISYAIENILKI